MEMARLAPERIERLASLAWDCGCDGVVCSAADLTGLRAELAARVRRLAGGRDETYVVTNNHFGGQALCNALELRAALRGERVPAPSELVEAFPQLRAVARAEGQQGLFD